MADKVEMIKIAELRKRDNLSQLELAKLLKVTEQEVISYEKTQPNLPGSIIIILSIVFGVPAHEILGAKGIEFDPYSDDYIY